MLDPAGVIQVGAGTQVGEIPLGVEGNGRVLGQVVDQLHLVGFAALLHVGKGLGPGLLAADDGQTLLADLLHLRLDLGKMLGGEGEGRVKVIVPALVNGGADGQLHLRPQALDGLRHDVGAGVPVGLAILRVFKSEFVFHKNTSVSADPDRLVLCGEGIKNTHPLNEIRGGIQQYSTVPPWLRLIAATH